jgi:tetratricopeptide (TPR) repeat protein
VSGRLNVGVVAAGMLVFLAVAIGLQIGRDRLYGNAQREIERVLYVQSGAAVQRLTLDFDALAADVYWIRAIQLYGGDRRDPARQRKYELLPPLLDLTTTLDPYFTIAYRFGAIFLSEKYPSGAGKPDQAIELLKKGIAAQPTKWQYYHDIAFVYYWHLRDFKQAAEWFQKAAQQPNAANWLQVMSAAMLTAGNDRAKARFLWQQMLNSDQDWLRRNAQRSLMQIDAMDGIDALQNVVNRFPPAAGESHTWQAIVRRGGLRGIPADPSGTPFVLDPATGKVSVSPSSALSPMPEEMQRALPQTPGDVRPPR